MRGVWQRVEKRISFGEAAHAFQDAHDLFRIDS
jgi:hypothetical protein